MLAHRNRGAIALPCAMAIRLGMTFLSAAVTLAVQRVLVKLAGALPTITSDTLPCLCLHEEIVVPAPRTAQWQLRCGVTVLTAQQVQQALQHVLVQWPVLVRLTLVTRIMCLLFRQSGPPAPPMARWRASRCSESSWAAPNAQLPGILSGSRCGNLWF